ncbi:glycosyl hydrolase family 65 protein [Promicromonospora soli]
MAGTVDLVLRCFAGLETRDDVLWLHPVLPPEISRAEFQILYRGQRVRVAHSAPGPAAAAGLRRRTHPRVRRRPPRHPSPWRRVRDADRCAAAVRERRRTGRRVRDTVQHRLHPAGALEPGPLRRYRRDLRPSRPRRLSLNLRGQTFDNHTPRSNHEKARSPLHGRGSGHRRLRAGNAHRRQRAR